MATKKVRICICYDGYSFKLVSNYYQFGHPLQSRLDFAGLEKYIKCKTAEAIGVPERNCIVTGKHYYQGVLAGWDITPEQAKKEKQFNELLKQNNITAHFRNLHTNDEGNKVEKMVDQSLSLDVMEMAFHKEFDVLVLVARDGDFVPMIEKLNKLAIDSVLVWWDTPEYMGGEKIRKPQRTSDDLFKIVTHNIDMSFIGDKRYRTDLEENIFNKNGSQRKHLLISSTPYQVTSQTQTTTTVCPVDNLIMNTLPRELTLDELKKTWSSTVISLNKEGYGGFIKGPVAFIDPKLNNFQFNTRDTTGIDELSIGSRVQFRLKLDPKRSVQLSQTLYRAYDVIGV